ncbi:hypothetical protein PIB30_066270 [Stylosanthes scabra]|uniref:Uncharacterized protein n=1 Tax=Stylosanthes scabra TaxID=79078 RepID=A0ABU6TLZ9_9FABA|nr:hypothetical protein [Stylosanthes scabra]
MNANINPKGQAHAITGPASYYNFIQNARQFLAAIAALFPTTSLSIMQLSFPPLSACFSMLSRRFGSSPPAPPPSSCRPKFNEPSLVASRLCTRPHAQPEGPRQPSVLSPQKLHQPFDLRPSSNVQISPRVAEFRAFF